MRLSVSVTTLSLVLVGAACSSPATGSGGAGGQAQATADTTTTNSGTGAGGSGGAGGAMRDHGAPSDVYPAFKPTVPSLVKLAGSVLATPKLVPVFFGNDDPTLTAKVTTFATKLGGTSYWTANTAEYGVGPITYVSSVQLTETPPAVLDDADIKAWLIATSRTPLRISDARRQHHLHAHLSRRRDHYRGGRHRVPRFRCLSR